jgi:divalent metal cation (Fe/Co/Zn/Cd) transporter
VRSRDLRKAVALERATLGWNVVGTVVLLIAAVGANSLALIGFALDSMIEIAASAVVLWELADVSAARRRQALRLIGLAFATLAIYLAAQAVIAIATDHRPDHSPLGIAWTALTAAVMFGLAGAKNRVGNRLANEVVIAEAKTRPSAGRGQTSPLGSSSPPTRHEKHDTRSWLTVQRYRFGREAEHSD